MASIILVYLGTVLTLLVATVLLAVTLRPMSQPRSSDPSPPIINALDQPNNRVKISPQTVQNDDM